MKEQNDGKQMTDVWRMPAIVHWKSLRQASNTKVFAPPCSNGSCINQGDLILDPICGNFTTGITVNLCERRFADLNKRKYFASLVRQDVKNWRILKVMII